MEWWQVGLLIYLFGGVVTFLVYSAENIRYIYRIRNRRELTAFTDLAIFFMVFQIFGLLMGLSWPVSVPGYVITRG